MASFNFVADHVVKGRIYPALAQHEARPYTQAWREFGQHWPYTTPLRVQEYCQQHEASIRTFAIHDELPADTYYPICLAFFDFTIDYIGLLPSVVKDRIIRGDLRLLFFYHEGDNPAHIKARLDQLCINHALDPACYVFVSANSSAQKLPRFVTFHDFELWYYQRNIDVPCCAVDDRQRQYDFTILSRLHKSWRFAAMADLYQSGILDHSIWSYCETADAQMKDCPIEIDLISQLRWSCSKFAEMVPRFCDDTTDQNKNNHAYTVVEHHQDSYCYVSLETQFDVDQSGGTFITEKTFKPIKHGQLFFVAAGCGSIAALRELGYDVFDDVLDHSYDTEPDHTRRWLQLKRSIIRAQQQGLRDIYLACRERLINNQRLFTALKQQRLNTLLRKINDCR